MPTKQIPMVAPDGTPGMVDSESAQDAVSQGYRPGLHVTAPNGDRGIVKFTDLKEAMTQGYKPALADNSATPQPGDPSLDQPKGFMQSITAPIPMMARGLYHSVADAPRDAGEAAIAGTTPQSGMVARALGRIGLAGYRNLIAPSIDAETAAEASVKAGHPWQALGQAAQGLPLVGGLFSAGAQAVNQFQNGDKSGALGTVIGNALPAYALGRLMKGEAPALKSALSPDEISARGVTKAVNPTTAAWPDYLRSAQSQIGNVQDYAARNGIAINNAADLSKVAGLAKDAAKAHYEENMLGPNADVQQPVTEGRYAGTSQSLRTINDRIGDINNEMRSAFRKPTPGQTMGALSGPSDEELLAEHGHLADILHNSLGDLTGLDPRDIAGTRTRIGQLGTLQGETQGAANMITSTAGRQEVGAGGNFPTSKAAILDRLISKIPGFDVESIAGKKLRDALSASTIQPSQLLDTYPGVNAPMSDAPAVTAYQQEAARRGAISNNGLADAQVQSQQARGVTKALRDAQAMEAKRKALLTPNSYPRSFGSTGTGLARYLALSGEDLTNEGPRNLNSDAPAENQGHINQESQSSPPPSSRIGVGVADQLALPASTGGMTPTQVPRTAYPELNADAARMRVEPTRFASHEGPSSAVRTVNPEGGVSGALNRLLLNAPDITGTTVNPTDYDLVRAIQQMRKRRAQ